MSLYYDSTDQFQILSIRTVITNNVDTVEAGRAVNYADGSYVSTGVGSPKGISVETENTTATGREITVAVYGVAPLLLSAPCNKGDALTVDANGAGLPGTIDPLIGYSLETGVAGNYVPVLIASPGFIN